MNTKPHIKLVSGRWDLYWQHGNASTTEEDFPFSKASEWCDARNLKEGRQGA
jgi:hypothetical protein